MTQTLHFTKMQGLGNDYIYVNCFENEVSDPKTAARKLSDRRLGIGGDGLVLIQPSDTADFKMSMFNADGSQGEMCGNAVRCIGKYVFERGLTDKQNITLETLAGPIHLDLHTTDGSVSGVTANMGEPKFVNQELWGPYEIAGESFDITEISMGNPHAVFFVDEITDHHILELGPQIEVHERFPNRTNVEFVQVIDRNTVKMRVWERGSGETFACGTGAAAVAVAAVLNEHTDRRVEVQLLGGHLAIEWGDDNNVYKTGPAEFVFDGQVKI